MLMNCKNSDLTCQTMSDFDGFDMAGGKSGLGSHSRHKPSFGIRRPRLQNCWGYRGSEGLGCIVPTEIKNCLAGVARTVPSALAAAASIAIAKSRALPVVIASRLFE